MADGDVTTQDFDEIMDALPMRMRNKVLRKLRGDSIEEDIEPTPSEVIIPDMPSPPDPVPTYDDPETRARLEAWARSVFDRTPE